MPRERRIVVEACVGRWDDALQAAEIGADRLEFCAALDVGGLTPELDDVARLRAATPVPFVVMIRPRAGDSCYSDSEWRTMLADAERALGLGAGGVVFGALTAERCVDVERVREMAEVVHRFAGKEVVFHRAFDDAADLNVAWQTLQESGVDRVLTSGGTSTALEGAAILRRLVADSTVHGGRPAVLVGGGVRAENVAALLRESEARQVHAACLADGLPPRLDAEKLRELIAAVRKFETEDG